MIPSNGGPGPVTSNEADVIEINMREDGFRYWGIVIYRATYKSEMDWEKFLRRFLGQVRQALEY
ncbi:uncharacterized protein N7515_009347 [Penicillium bovifimosum]|uniref:Uncharacterized protein n=1 Tax=Penicillium bovifimosum TaxID=126998 RepID=A0A9W9KUF2_9EURO|nr:uncharacterized protein N7515_009347 [Penicillium bovifimosum]KAJ5121386.1 hypothetical protein N7515_009347 [Penicillium bovifimosum]